MSLKQTLPSLLMGLDCDVAFKYFRKDTYFEFLEKYRDLNKNVYDDILEVFESGDDWEASFREASDELALQAKNFVNKKFILNRSRHMIDLSYVLTCYVIPGILDMNHDKCHRACEIITDSWQEAFPKLNRVGIAPKEEFITGFKKTILGIPIEK